MALYQTAEQARKSVDFYERRFEEWATKAEDAQRAAEAYRQEADEAGAIYNALLAKEWADEGHVVDGKVVRCPDYCEDYCYRMTDEDKAEALAQVRLANVLIENADGGDFDLYSALAAIEAEDSE